MKMGFLLFCKAIEKNKSLKKIEFGDDFIFRNRKNKEYLLEFLKSNHNIEEIIFYIDKNVYDRKFIRKLKSINTNKNIEVKFTN